MKTKTKNTLTAAEKYQFSLCESVAKTIPSQRAAIQREGLRGMSRAQIRAAQLDYWKGFKSRPDHGNAPAWVVAAKFLAAGSDWRHAACPTAAGTVQGGYPALPVQALCDAAYNAAAWGRSRKRGCGEPTLARCGITETDNGKTGWDRVVHRAADYICVLSPRGDQLYWQYDRAASPVVSRVLRGHFMLNGKRTPITVTAPASRPPTPRSDARRLRVAGLDARVVRQTPTMIELGSGETLQDSGLGISVVCVVACGNGSYYHPSRGQAAESVREAIERRATAAAASKPVEHPERVWVSIQDSIAAGNCGAGTRLCADMLHRLLGATGEVGAVRADWLLGRRNDDFTRRACVAAAAR